MQNCRRADIVVYTGERLGLLEGCESPRDRRDVPIGTHNVRAAEKTETPRHE
jgi:hypothetical protein